MHENTDLRADTRLSALFPEPGAAKPFWRTRRARFGLVTATTVALVASGFVAVSASGSEATKYRTAVVGVHDVASHTSGVATVEPVAQAAVAFPVAGTVSSVAVEIGDDVVVGDTLSTLDTADLEVALHQRQSTLATAELELANALTAEDASAGSNTGSGATAVAVTTPVSSAAPTTTAPGSPVESSGIDTARLAAAQRAVVDAQRAVGEALSSADAALTSADAVCDIDAAVATSTTSTSTTTSVPASGDTVAATTTCRTALADVRTAQDAARTAQDTLAAAATKLDELVAEIPSTSTTATTPAITAPTTTAATTRSSTGTGSTATGGSGAATPAAGNAASTTPSSEDLIAMQKAIDAAALEVIVATHALEQSTIVSPIAGTVVNVGLATGDAVAAASSTANITIVGDGGYEVTTSVAVDDLPDVEVGQAATVAIDGSDDDLSGEVVAIAVAPDSSTSSTYRVTVGLSEPDVDVPNGATGSVSIVTGATDAAVAVPTSAVTTDGDRHTVTVLDGATTTDDVEIEVGVMGDTWTEVTSGVDTGDVVVLADLGAALPGSATATSSENGADATSSLPGGGMFPGGGFPGGGGFPAGGPPG